MMINRDKTLDRFIISLGLRTKIVKGDYESESSKQPPCSPRRLNFTAFGEDKNGKMCRGKISTFACYGTCETNEYGTYKYPHEAGSQIVCNYEKVKQRLVILSDCENGANDEARIYQFTEAISCSCTSCNPKTTNCVTVINPPPKKRLGGRLTTYTTKSKSKGGKNNLNQFGEGEESSILQTSRSYDWRKPMKVATRIRLLTRQVPNDDDDV